MPAPDVFLSKGLHILQRQARCGGETQTVCHCLPWCQGLTVSPSLALWHDLGRFGRMLLNTWMEKRSMVRRWTSLGLRAGLLSGAPAALQIALSLHSFIRLWLPFFHRFYLPLFQRSDAAMKALARILASGIQSTSEPWSAGTIWCNLDTKAQKRGWAKEGREKWKKWKRLWKRWKRQGRWKRWWKNVAEKDGTPGQKGFSVGDTQQDLFLFFSSAINHPWFLAFFWVHSISQKGGELDNKADMNSTGFYMYKLYNLSSQAWVCRHMRKKHYYFHIDVDTFGRIDYVVQSMYSVFNIPYLYPSIHLSPFGVV